MAAMQALRLLLTRVDLKQGTTVAAASESSPRFKPHHRWPTSSDEQSQQLALLPTSGDICP